MRTFGSLVDREWSRSESKTFPAGRVCIACTTRLSIYNPRETCSVHTKPKRYVHKGRYKHEFPKEPIEL